MVQRPMRAVHVARVRPVDTSFIFRASAFIAAQPLAQAGLVHKAHPRAMWSMQVQINAYTAMRLQMQVGRAPRVRREVMYSAAE